MTTTSRPMSEPFIIVIPTRDVHPVVADWYRPTLLDGGDVTEIVIMCHGFSGHRRWGFIPVLAERLCAAGFGALAIDFSHNGRVPADAGLESAIEPVTPESNGRFVSPKLFRANTISREVQDLADVIEWIRDLEGGVTTLGVAPDARLGLWGHSRGGVVSLVAVLAGVEVDAISTWSASAHADHYTERQKAQWREKGELAFTDYKTGTRLALGTAFLDDLERNGELYAVGERAFALAAPHLIVHGEHDPTVPVEDSYRFYDTPTIRADKKLLRLLTGHTYAYEPGKDSEALTNATKATVEWFDHYLRDTSDA